MSATKGSVYPFLTSHISDKDLARSFTLSKKELMSLELIKKPVLRLGCMLNKKIFDRVGYFMPMSDIPEKIVEYVKDGLKIVRPITKKSLLEYDKSRSCRRHQKIILKELGVESFTPKEHSWLAKHALASAHTNEMIEDIINAMCEQLLRHRYELPPFQFLRRIAKTAKSRANNNFFETINNRLSKENRLMIDELFEKNNNVYSDWYQLKREPKKLGIRELRSYNQHVHWLDSVGKTLPIIDIPVNKLKQFYFEAYALDARDMMKLALNKRYALACILIKRQHALSLDHVGGYYIKVLKKIEFLAQNALTQYILERQSETDLLVNSLKNILTAFDENDGKIKQIDAITRVIGDQSESLLNKCDEHLTFSENNHIPFMSKSYGSKRSLLYDCLHIINLQPTSDDQFSMHVLTLLKNLQNIKSKTLTIDRVNALIPVHFDMSWIPDRWKKTIITKELITKKPLFSRRYLELWLFMQLKLELRNGDLCIPNSAEYVDYRLSLVNDKILEEESDAYGEEIEMPVSDSRAFVVQLKNALLTLTKKVDDRFQENETVSIKDGKLSFKKNKAKNPSADIEKLDALLTSKLPQTNIVDVLTESEKWLELNKLFPPLSGREIKIDEPEKRFITTLFCYGCNFGPTQTSKSIRNISAKQVAWLKLRHTTSERLDKAIERTINEYNKLDLPKYWGDGSSASADGTIWDLYEQNLLSEYHIRYGGYGGIGYYHVSNTYIALFSHFIPCGVYEATHILDGLLKNESDIQPNTIHGDTQAQSYPVFGLSHLLGIDLMPRIRGLSDCSFFKADKRHTYKNIDSLFTGSIDFNLIATHLREMLRVVISIKKGKLESSTILKRLGTYSRKNKLYTAFRELGKAVRTIFLLKYIDSAPLRHTINAETNKSEEFNAFAKWLFFGNSGVISENLMDQQTKIIKYNHLVANMVILNNAYHMTRVMRELVSEGVVITEEMLRGTAPYRMGHINRHGRYFVNVRKSVPPIDYESLVLQ